MLGTENGTGTTASKFPHKDDTQRKGGTDEDLDDRPIRRDRAKPKSRTELTDDEDVQPPALASSSGGRRDDDLDLESLVWSTRSLPKGPNPRQGNTGRSDHNGTD
eukprot:2240151-Amphidinium_carterae.1